MNPMKLIVDTLAAVIEIIYVLTFISIYSNEKRLAGWRIIVYISAFILLNVLSVTFVENQILFSAITIVLIFSYSFVYNMPVFKRVICCLIVYFASVMGEIFSGLLVITISKISVEEMQDNIISYLQVIMISKISLYAVVRILKHFMRNKFAKISNVAVMPFFILPVSSFLILFGMNDYVIKINTFEANILAFFVGILLLLSNIVVFFIFDYILKEKEKQNTVEREALQLNLEKQYYSELLKKQVESNKTIHDLKNKLFGIKELLQTDTSKGVLKINEVCEIVEATTNIKVTGLDSVDAVINSKMKIAKANDAVIKTVVAISSIKEIDVLDMCVILGNLLDNSIEAVEKLKDEKTILLEMQQNMNFLSITISNPCVPVNVNSKMETTKENKNLHGFGLKNVKEIVEKYNGEMSCGVNANQFVTNIVLEN